MKESISGAVAICFISTMITPVFAQDKTSTSLSKQAGFDIVVTAQKRAQNIQDIGIAVSAIGQQGLDGLGNRDLTSLVTQVPSLQVNQYSPTSTVFNIRGISQNDVSDAQEAPIAFYNDEVYIGALGAISGQNFDLERVEVLRGPQGTLFGRNATGGLVQVITAKPTQNLEAYFRITAGRFDRIATEAAVSGPISEDIRARIAVTRNHSDGYVRNTLGGPKGQNSRFFGVRGQIEADVGSRGKVSAKVEYLRNDDETSYYHHEAAGIDADGLGFRLAPNVDFWTGRPGRIPFTVVTSCPGCDIDGYRGPEDVYTTTSDKRGQFDRKYWNGTLRYDHDLSFADLTSITNYQNLKKLYAGDSDGGPTPSFTIAGLRSSFNIDSSQDLYQISQELRLAKSTGRLKWVTGLYGLKIKSDNFLRLGTGPNEPFLRFSTQRYSQVTETLAAFGQAEYAVNDVVSVIAGARYSWEWKTFDWSWEGSGPFFPPPIQFNPANTPQAKLKFDDYSGKIEVDVRPAEGVLLYASVNRGTKSGGFNVQSFPPISPRDIPFDEEVLTNYEGGYKLTLLDRRLNLNGSIFHYDYDGYQAFSRPAQGVTRINNKPAKITGIEAEINAHPFSGLGINAWASHLLKAEVRGIVLPRGRVADRHMPQAPNWSVGGSLTYDVKVGPGTLGLFTNWKYDSAQFFSAFNSQIDRERGRLLGDARISYAIDNLELAVFVNNLTDKRYRVFSLDLGNDSGFGESIYAPPRSWGASVTYRFGQ